MPSSPVPLVLSMAFAGRRWIKEKARQELCCNCPSSSPSLHSLTIITPASESDVAPVTQETGLKGLTQVLQARALIALGYQGPQRAMVRDAALTRTVVTPKRHRTGAHRDRLGEKREGQK